MDNKTVDYKAKRTQAKAEFKDLLSVKGVDKDPVKQWAIYFFIKAKYDVYEGDVYERSLDLFDLRDMPCFPYYRADKVIELFVKMREWDREGKEIQNAEEESRHG